MCMVCEPRSPEGKKIISPIRFFQDLKIEISLPLKVKETIPTGEYPYDLYYLPWLEEVWVHTWTKSTFDVISIAGSLKKIHTAIKAHVQPGK